MEKSKAAGIAFYSILGVLFGFLLIWNILNVYIKKRFIEYAVKSIYENSGKSYILSINDISIDLFTQAITLKELIIEPSAKKDWAREQYVFKLRLLKISDFGMIPFLKERNLEIGRVDIEEPQFSLYEAARNFKNNYPARRNTSLYSFISKKLRGVRIREVMIRNAQVSLFKETMGSDFYFNALAINLSILNFKVDSVTNQQGKLFLAENLDLSIAGFDLKTDNRLYTVLGKRIYASYKDSLITMDSLQLIPNYNKEQFTKEAGHQISRLKIDLGSVIGKKANVRSLFEHNQLVLGKMNLNACIIEVYRDNTAIVEPTVKPTFQALLRKLTFSVKIDTVQMYDGKVVSEILSPGESSVLKLDLTRMNGLITGLNNDSLRYTDLTKVEVKLSTYISDKGKINLYYFFPLKQGQEHFDCSGTLSPMTMTLFNPMIPESMNVVIKNGTIDSSSFSFVTRKNVSTGSMRLIYHGLQIEMVSKKGKTGIKERLGSYAINRLIVRESNPNNGEGVRISKINKIHDPYRFFIFYSIQSMISGVVPAIINSKNADYLKRIKH